MNNIGKLLDRLGDRTGLSDRQISRELLGLSYGAVTHWRTSRSFPNDEQARRIAELLGLDPAYVLALVHGERSKSKETRATWRRVADAFGKAAAIAAVAIAPALTSPEARAGFNSSGNVPTSPAHQGEGRNTQCPTSRRRRPSFADTLLLSLGLSDQRIAL